VAQAAGLVVIPPEVFDMTLNRCGEAGLLPLWVTDGSAPVFGLILMVSLIKYGTPWA
jgi:hypothetical protein